jgi:histone deacetylase complex regulatory component SIN3
MDVKEEILKLLPTRDSNRRMLSNLLKPWNDIENQKFELLPNSSYYKIEEGFPIPTCTGKMMDEIYHKNINDQYLSLATGSENFKFKFRNTNEEQIYKTEAKMYELDTQIDNIERSREIIRKQCEEYDLMSEVD